jgi:hypothetical protein
VEHMIFVEPFQLGYNGVAPSITVSRGAGGGNLLTPHPQEVWQDSTAVGAVSIDIDLRAVRDWDVIALINCNALPTAIWTISYGIAGHGESVAIAGLPVRIQSEDVADATGPALFTVDAMISSRYVRLSLTQGAGGVPLSAGVLLIGKGWSPTFPRELGSGRPPVDTGTRTRIEGGGLATVEGTLLSGFRWVFGDLHSSDLAKIWGMFRRLRTTRPFLLVEYPNAPVAEGIHWGTFVNIEAYERRDATKSQWSMRMEDWA